MAFKRTTKGGGSGNRTTTTLNEGKGTTRSSSWSTTGSQKTKSGGARYTSRANPDGSTTKIVTRHLANGYISRTQKTTGKYKEPKAPKPAKKPSVIRYSRGKSSSTIRMRKGESVAMFWLAVMLGMGWAILTYWKWILLIAGLFLAGYISYRIYRK